MSKLSVGVIGLGMGRYHLAEFKASELCDVVAIADTDEARLKELGDKHGVSVRYTDAEDMIAKEDLDMICIATPNKFHKPLTLAGFEAGCHVLCEKPMAENAEETKARLDRDGFKAREPYDAINSDAPDFMHREFSATREVHMRERVAGTLFVLSEIAKRDPE